MSCPDDSSTAFVAGTLWDRVVEVSQQALHNGHLRPIPTRVEILTDAAAQFRVRVATNLQRKQEQRRQQPRDFNPFLPYEPQLFVAHVSEDHVALLNKFNVVDHHLLLVTRHFESQDTRLSLSDFQALWRCLCEYDSLGFYNSGTIAGASQPHKHLQLVPLNSARNLMPLEPLFQLPKLPIASVAQSTQLPFAHRLVRLESHATCALAAIASCEAYERMLASLGHKNVGTIAPYNLLVTREWMLFVPRTAECFQSISLNAMAFVGSLFVQNRAQFTALQTAGPMTALRYVARET